MINSAINPLTALLRVPNGELLERPSARQMLRTLAYETAQVARAEDISLAFSDPAAAAEDVARRTATNRSSMLQESNAALPPKSTQFVARLWKLPKNTKFPPLPIGLAGS